ncbi:UDP-glycosyltransferase UGT5-like [Episyrphus balteatus]|uniref:UDP-glycosyltransferase UGT5-like n=1 Tax=Episyrphus balteatus TaxID=286459 RepID=UPI002485A5B1|nr:UDP-glycosyltransferase UGT5-like [Episyrphus balteatus]
MLPALKIIFVSLIITSTIALSNSAHILGLFPTPFKSHLIIHSAIADALVERGHDVTVVSTLPKINKNSKFRHIQLDIKEFSPALLADYINDPPPFYKRYTYFMEEINRYANDSLHHWAMQKLMREESFDLVIQGFFLNEFLLGVAAHFKCPVVVSFMIRTGPRINSLVGNPQEIAYVPSYMSGGKQPMGFFDRVNHFICMNLLENGLVRYIEQSNQKHFYNANFPQDKYPSYDDMIKNISLVLTNHHFSQSPIRPDVQALIEIGGIQIKDNPAPLPEDLQSIMDKSSEHGVIFFSVGSNIPSSKLDPIKVKIIFDLLSKLPQTILWKWDDSNNLPGTSSNIIYKTWLPQESILSHPNVKLFITHGGQGSVVESQFYGVPMVGVPMFGDQPANMENVELLGFGLSVKFATLTKEAFENAVTEVLRNKKYTNTVRKFATLYKDRPMTARQTAVFWIEYVLRHHGAPHMQSPAVHLNALQLMSVDVIGFLLAILYIVFKIIKTCFSMFLKLLVKRKSKTE